MDKLMSEKEVYRGRILDLYKDGKINQQEAAKRMKISSRQVRRLSKRYQSEGLPGLASKKRGVASNRRLNTILRTKVVELIGVNYPDFGPTLAQEKLKDRHDISLSVESTRQLMIEAGYWKPKRGASICTHAMRERRAQFGELIQIDGSPHNWFEGRGAACTLLVFIDDATGQLTQLRFVPTETTLGYMQVLHDHILLHGIPAALYSDKHSIFRINAKEADPEAETQFSRAARALGIECIHAHSPQAKGRVERANQTLQDRLVKEMRLAGISDRESANAWLPGYIKQYNQRFSVTPKNSRDAHLPYSNTQEALTRILSIQQTRLLSKNLSCQYAGKLLQIKTTGAGLGLRGAKVTLHEHFDGRQELLWKKRKLAYSQTEKPVRQSNVADGKTVNARVDMAMAQRNSGHKHKPAPKHPWRITPTVKSTQNRPQAAS